MIERCLAEALPLTAVPLYEILVSDSFLLSFRVLGIQADENIPSVLFDALDAFKLLKLPDVLLADSYSLFYLHLKRNSNNREEAELTTSLPSCTIKNLKTYDIYIVELHAGLEPATSWVQTERSNQLS